ncbi:MAG TPA: TIGR03619 family F420-dependent LLM class oxidoreductase [Acidimicrobiales bacterium]
MRASITLFGLAASEYGAIAERAEETGFDVVWIADHLVTPVGFAGTYPYNETGFPGYDAATPLVDSFVLAGHLAARTRRIRLGTGVCILPLRNVFAAARAVATVQDLAEGRFLFGVGTGWMREEFDAVGEAFDGRGGRTDEMIEVMQELWTGAPVEHHGRHYDFPAVQLAPAPPEVPLVFGGTTLPALRRTARFGRGWFAPSRPLEEALAICDRLAELRAEAGTADQPFDIWFRMVDPPSADVVARYEDAGVDDIVIGPFWAGGATKDSPLGEKLDAVSRAAELLVR